MRKTKVDIIEEQSECNVDEERKWAVYMHTSPSTKRYVGITGEKDPARRWGSTGNGYLRKKPNGEYQQPAMAAAVLKYPEWNKWKHEILFSGLTKQEAEEKEIELISLYNTRDPRFGYNIRSGGSVLAGDDHPMSGKHHSQETKNKMRQTRIERKIGIGESKSNYGRTPKDLMSEEAYERWKLEIGVASKRNWEDEVFREKHSKAMVKYWDEHPERKEYLRESQLGEKSHFYGKTPQEMMGFDEEKIQKWKENISVCRTKSFFLL